MGRLLRMPLVHFVLLGGALYGGARFVGDGRPPPADGGPVVVDAARLERLAADYAREAGTPPTRAQLEGLVAQTVDDELLFRAARAARLDVEDRSVRLRLVQKMRAISDDPRLVDEALYRAALTLGLDDDLVVRRILAEKMRLLLAADAHAAPPADAELSAWMEAHRADYEMSAAVSFTQLFLSARRHGARLDADAAALGRWLRRADPPPDRAAARSDPFPLGTTMRARSRAEIERQLGDALATAVMALPVGRWSEPLPSPFGLHLVRVDERRPAALLPLDAVRRQVRLAVEQSRAQARLQAALTRLRGRYEVRVDERALPEAIAAAARLPLAPLASAVGTRGAP